MLRKKGWKEGLEPATAEATIQYSTNWATFTPFSNEL